jgi:uncharacterized HAD superfamily protein
MKIAVDLDEVLVQFNKGFIKYLNTSFGRRYTFNSITDYDYTKCLNITRKEIDEVVTSFHGFPSFMKILPMDGSVDGLDKISKNHDIYIITARPPTIEEKTKEYLKKTFPNDFVDIIFTNSRDEYRDGNSIKNLRCVKCLR